MDSSLKHDMWEMIIEGHDDVQTASHLLSSFEDSNPEISQSMIKSRIALSAQEGRCFAKCAECLCPLTYVAASINARAHFKHDVNRAVDLDVTHTCFYYSQSHSFFGNQTHYNEGYWHINTKQWLLAQIKQTPYLLADSIAVERYIFSKSPDANTRRRPDIAFTDVEGNRYAIELTRWWLSPLLVAQREAFFKQQEINLIWLFSPDCQNNNNATMNLILYGSPTAQQALKPEVLQEVECNAFVLTEEAKKRTEETHSLYFDILYPVAQYHIDKNSIRVELHQAQYSLQDLSLAPSTRLPFAVRSSTSFSIAYAKYSQKQRTDLANWIKEVWRGVSDAQVAQDLNAITHTERSLLNINSIPDDYRWKSHLMRKVNKAQHQLVTASSHIRTALARAEFCKKIIPIRTCVNAAIGVAKNSSTYCNADVEAEHLKEMWTRVERMAEHSKLRERFERAIHLINQVKMKVEQDKEAIELAKQSAPDTIKIRKEATDFSEELKQGLSEIPNGFLSIKISRLTNTLRRKGFCDEAEALQLTFDTAKKKAADAFIQSHYPKMSQGWCSATPYDVELNKARGVLATKYSHRDRNVEQYMVQKTEVEALIQRFTTQVARAISAEQVLVKRPTAAAESYLRKHRQYKVEELCSLATDIHQNYHLLDANTYEKLIELKDFYFINSPT